MSLRLPKCHASSSTPAACSLLRASHISSEERSIGSRKCSEVNLSLLVLDLRWWSEAVAEDAEEAPSEGGGEDVDDGGAVIGSVGGGGGGGGEGTELFMAGLFFWWFLSQ